MCRSLIPFLKVLTGFLLAVFLPLFSAYAKDAESLASQILESSGVKGGLVVHIGCGEGSLTAELSRGGRTIVHGLCLDPAAVDKVRSTIQAKGLSGTVSIDGHSGGLLPYADNLVNLVVSENLGDVPMAEVMRVLCPNGVAYIMDKGKWTLAVKPRPEGMDEWTHDRHGPDGNLVSQDKLVKPPFELRWVAPPKWPRQHYRGVQAIVSAVGRLFYVYDKNPPGLNTAPALSLIARDANNGILLWKKPVQIEPNRKHPLALGNEKFKKRTLVADGNRVYTVLKPDGPLVALDAATGEQIHVYSDQQAANEVVLCKGALVLAGAGRVWAVDAKTGKSIWLHDAKEAKQAIRATSIVTDGSRVYFLNTAKAPFQLVGLDFATGKELWRSSTGVSPVRNSRAVSKPMLFCQSGILALVHRAQSLIHVYSAEDGKHLWRKAKHNYFHYSDGIMWGNDGKNWFGFEPMSGAQRTELKGKGEQSQKCNRSMATDRFILNSRQMFLIDRKTNKTKKVRGIRGSCNFGLTPANGLIYTFPHDCTCGDFMRGIIAYSPYASESGRMPADVPALEKGVKVQPAADAAAGPADWASHRHDPRRSGSTSTKVPANLKLLWRAKAADEGLRTVIEADDPISSPVAANGKVLVAVKDSLRISAYDSKSGKLCWHYNAGGRVDSAPTIYRGLCYFGCRDGWVYCLRMNDGKLVWRFSPAPRARRIIANDRLESVKPVSGSVLIHKDTLFFAVGRHVEMNEGVSVCALEPATGKLLWRQSPPIDKKGLHGVCDLLTTDGNLVYMNSFQFDPVSGQSSPSKWQPKHRLLSDQGLTKSDKHRYLRGGLNGLLDSSMSKVNFWTDGRAIGNLLVFDDRATYAFRIPRQPGVWRRLKSSLFTPGKGYTLFAKSNAPGANWSRKVPVRIRAMVLADRTLFIAGPRDLHKPEGAELWALSANDGKKISSLKLDAPPVFDGMAAAWGRLHVSTRSGELLCFGK